MKKKQIIRFPSAEYFGEVKNGKSHGKGTNYDNYDKSDIMCLKGHDLRIDKDNE